jgi:hypothetical protein
MRVTLMVLATLLLLIGGGIGGLLTWRDLRDAGDIEELTGGSRDEAIAAAKLVGGETGKEALEMMELPGKLKIGAVPAALAGLLAIVLLVAMYRGRGVGTFAGALAIAAVAAVLLNPHYDTGKFGPAPARSIAIFLAGFAIAGALLAFLADRMRQGRAARAPIRGAAASPLA